MSTATAVKPSIYRIQVLERAFGVLDVLAEDPGGVSLAELSSSLRLHKATTHRLLMVLEAARFVERNAGTGKYHLGSRLMELGLSAISRLDVYDVARPHLRSLVEKTGETAHLAVFRDGEVVSLIDVESRQTLRTPSAVGERRPAYCTALGKAMLAYLSPEHLEQYLRGRSLKAYTRKTITSGSRLRTELRMVRDRGYAIDDEEWEVGLRCIGAPVHDSAGAVIAAVSIAGPAFRVSPQHLVALTGAVVASAECISSALGYRVSRV
jgi:IclR family transcriptional regulator, KDG regulon repressor